MAAPTTASIPGIVPPGHTTADEQFANAAALQQWQIGQGYELKSLLEKQQKVQQQANNEVLGQVSALAGTYNAAFQRLSNNKRNRTLSFKPPYRNANKNAWPQGKDMLT